MQTVIKEERAGGGAYRGAINTDDECGAENRESFSHHCVSITFKKEINPFCS